MRNAGILFYSAFWSTFGPLFSFLFLSFFLYFSAASRPLFFFFFFFFSFLFWQLKKPKIGLGYASKMSSHTYARRFVRHGINFLLPLLLFSLNLIHVIYVFSILWICRPFVLNIRHEMSHLGASRNALYIFLSLRMSLKINAILMGVIHQLLSHFGE